MTQVELQFGAATDVGRVREVNEDSHLAAPPVFVVADGMGGLEGGDVASAIVVEEFDRLTDARFDPDTGADVLARTLVECQRRIAAYGEEHGRGQAGRRWYAGTTAVAALLVADDRGPHWLLANIGDSRVYRFHDTRLEQVSRDHSLVQDLADAGQISPEDRASHPERNVVTRALGGPEEPQADYFLLPVESAPRLLLCSDGVNGMLDDGDMEQLLREHEDPRDAADRLVAAAVAAGGEDNATAVVVDVVGLGDDSDPPTRSLEQPLG